MNSAAALAMSRPATASPTPQRVGGRASVGTSAFTDMGGASRFSPAGGAGRGRAVWRLDREVETSGGPTVGGQPHRRDDPSVVQGPALGGGHPLGVALAEVVV